MSGVREEQLARDAEARRAAQTEFSRPVIVEAGAGTGKTTTLVARTVVWCVGAGWDEAVTRADGDRGPARIAAAVLQGVVAITFTEAAAAEMATRVAEALASLAAGRAVDLPGLDLSLLPGKPEPGERQRRARHLLGVLDHLTVRTIHAFCRSLLSDHPLEAGLHPELAVDADGARTEEVVRTLVEGRARDAYLSDREEPLLELAARGKGPRRVAEALALLVERGVPADALNRSPFDRDGASRMAGRLRRRLLAFEQAGGDRLPAVRRGPVARQLAATVSATLADLEALPGESIELAEALVDGIRARWDDRSLGRLKAWRKGRFTQSEVAVLGESPGDFQRAVRRLHDQLRQLRRIQPRAFEQARRCLAPLLAETERRLGARGILTFAGLLRETYRLLVDRPRVRRRERRRIRQLLVDEFQDTDRLQCEIVRLLTLDGPPESRPGLFLVGDPKQSIYGWRNADLAAYESFVAAALAAGGRRYSLLQNFRSAAPILDEVNRTIAPVMKPKPGLQPPYEPLVACDSLQADPGYRGGGRTAIEYWVSWEQDPEGAPTRPATATAIATLEARAIAADLAGLRREGVGWNRIGILLRATTQQDAYLEALRAAGIPFQVSRDKQYYRRREIIDAAALVRAVVHPTDHLSLLTFLRSPTVGVPDAAWIPLWRHSFPKLATDLLSPSPAAVARLRAAVDDAAAELPKEIPGLAALQGWEENLIDAMICVADLRQSYRREATDRFVVQLRRQLLSEAIEAARFLGGYRIANLDRFFRRLTESLEELGGDVQAVLRTIRRSVVEAAEAQEALPKHTAEEAVQVMTIHAAKGLEFDHLYLAQAHARNPPEDRREIDTDERWSPGDRALEYALFGSPTPGLDRVVENRRRVVAAERVRTLYVAMTRAKRRLVVVGCWPFTGGPGESERAATYVDLLAHRAPADGTLGPHLEKATDRTGALVDETGARWVFLGRSGPAEAPEAPRTPAPLPTPSMARQAARELARGRRAAARRAKRQLVRAASAELGDRLARLLEARDEPTTQGAGREVALAVGEAVHRMFEGWDLAADPARELQQQATALLERVGTDLPPTERRQAQRRARELLDRFATGRLFDRFDRIRDRVAARELPLVAPPGAAAASGPLTAWTGAIDLIYRHPEDDEPVLVDFKSDQVDSETEIAARAAAYDGPARIYRHAVREALDLDRLPVYEIWFLWADRVWELER